MSEKVLQKKVLQEIQEKGQGQLQKMPRRLVCDALLNDY